MWAVWSEKVESRLTEWFYKMWLDLISDWRLSDSSSLQLINSTGRIYGVITFTNNIIYGNRAFEILEVAVRGGSMESLMLAHG